MSTRSTSSQYSWRQFTERERETRESRERERERTEKVNHDDYTEVETPRRSTRNKDKVKTNTNVHEQKKTSKKETASKQGAASKQQEAAAASVTQKAVTFDTVKPVRTRAQKRFADAAVADAAKAMVQLQDTRSAPEKAERRTAYWVKRDDKRRQSARLLKIQSQE